MFFKNLFRLYDDGGLTLLLPYILKTRAKFAKCQLRVFFLANKMNTLDEEARSMAALLVKHLSNHL
jgi:solute carrier family 12 sodium/potassium/chloride transporter 2